MVKCDANGKEGKLLCCKCIFDRIKATVIWPRSSLKNHQNVQKMHFFARSSKIQWVKGLSNYINIKIHHGAIQSKFLEKGCSVLDHKQLVFVPDTL